MKLELKTKLGVLVFFFLLSTSFSAILAPNCFSQSYQPISDTGIIEEQTTAFGEAAGIEVGQPVLIGDVAAIIIRIILSLLGVIFILLIIYAGMLWLTSAGNEEKIEKAKKIMTAAVIGVVIILAAYLITYFVIDRLLEIISARGGGGVPGAN